MVQRADGGLTIGDTHEYEHPFAFDVPRSRTSTSSGSSSPSSAGRCRKIRRRWAGVYAQCTDTSARRAPPAGAGRGVAGDRARRTRHDLLARHRRDDRQRAGLVRTVLNHAAPRRIPTPPTHRRTPWSCSTWPAPPSPTAASSSGPSPRAAGALGVEPGSAEHASHARLRPRHHGRVQDLASSVTSSATRTARSARTPPSRRRTGSSSTTAPVAPVPGRPRGHRAAPGRGPDRRPDHRASPASPRTRSSTPSAGRTSSPSPCARPTRGPRPPLPRHGAQRLPAHRRGRLGARQSRWPATPRTTCSAAYASGAGIVAGVLTGAHDRGPRCRGGRHPCPRLGRRTPGAPGRGGVMTPAVGTGTRTKAAPSGDAPRGAGRRPQRHPLRRRHRRLPRATSSSTRST